jgi:drug/metabolite transporter (DMT)-like permease
MPTNMFLALLAAGFWGMGDFSGGMSVKSAPAEANPLGAALRVVLLSHLTSLTVLVGLSLGLGLAFPGGASLTWGLGAGVCGGVSLAAFYIALSRGAMGASAAISGLLAAAIPAGVTLAVDGSPGWYRLAGFAVAGVAIWLIAAGPAERESLGTILLATGAGIGFGLYFVALKYAGEHAAPVWTMAMARVGSISTCALILAGLRVGGRSTGPVSVSRRMVLWILSTAAFDTSGNLLFIAATRAGRLDIASVLASLYPASTILLAAGVLRERPTGRQMVGMGVAAVAVGMITL